MKKYIIGLMLAFVLATSGVASALTAAQWQSASQTAKISAFTAEVQNKANALEYGYQCIAWVQKILAKVSGNAVQTPYPVSNASTWQQPNLSFVAQPKSPTSYMAMNYGDIIQMQIHNQMPPYTVNPHTAVVLNCGYGTDLWGVTGNGYYWADSNLASPLTASIHFMTFTSFNLRIGRYGTYGDYTVYRIK